MEFVFFIMALADFFESTRGGFGTGLKRWNWWGEPALSDLKIFVFF